MNELYDMLLYQEYAEVDKCLKNFSMCCYDPTVILAFLVITKPWKNQLIESEWFFHQATLHIREFFSDEAEDILDGVN